MTALRRVLAVLIGLRGLTNFGKPLPMGSGFVIGGPWLAAWLARGH